MKVIMRTFLAIVFVSVSAYGWAADRPAGEAGATLPSVATNDQESSEPEIGPIDRISRLVDLQLKSSDGSGTWKTADALLDVEVGQLVMLLAESAAPDASNRAIWLPWRQVASALTPQKISDAQGGPVQIEMTEADLKKAPPANFDRKLSREWAAKVIGSVRPVGPPSVTGRKYDPDSELVRWSKLRNKAVVNREQQELGAIIDLAVAAPSGRIGYAAMTSPDLPKEQLRPLPLSAFVAPPGKDQWLLELPEDIVKNTATFARSAWPKAIDQGWVEYVHVRYGRSPFEGVRLEPHGEKTGAR